MVLLNCCVIPNYITARNILTFGIILENINCDIDRDVSRKLIRGDFYVLSDEFLIKSNRNI